MARPSLAARLLCLTLAFAPLSIATAADPPLKLTWSDLAPLPNATGLGGPLVGTHQGALIAAGGANFPDAPPWEVDGRPAGSKVWHTKIYVLTEPGGQWKEAGELPYPLAYAPAVSTSDGIYILGGETFGQSKETAEPTNYPTAEVLRLQYDSAAERVNVTRNALPPLPQACRYHAAAIADGVIYVAAGHAAADGSQLYSKTFWQLDLAAEEPRWERRIPWPGRAREKMSLVVVAGAGVKPGVYLLGGSMWMKDDAGQFDFARFRYFDDVYRVEAAGGEWDSARLASIPPADGRGTIAAAPAIAIGDRYLLTFSGDTGEFITLPNQDRELFGKQVRCYDTHTNRWTLLPDMPLGVVTTSAVWWRERIVIDPRHYEGESTDRVVAPMPLGRMGRRLQQIQDMPPQARPIDLYAALAEVAR